MLKIMSMIKFKKEYLYPCFSLSILLVCWFVLGDLSSSNFVPSIKAVLIALEKWLQDGRLFYDLFFSLGRVIPSLLIGSLFGIIIGLMTGRIRSLYLFVGPILNSWKALPAVATVPFFLAIFGVSEVSRIAIISLGVFFPVWVSTHEGGRNIDAHFFDAAKDMELSSFQRSVFVIFPATIPYSLSGVRVGIGMAYIMVFISEWIGANEGIGYQLSVAHAVSSIEFMVIGLLVLGTLGYCTDVAFVYLVKAFFPWVQR